jgi:hypothetical protein
MYNHACCWLAATFCHMTVFCNNNNRPVDCESGAPIEKFIPGHISRDWIYRNGTKAGWGWLDYFSTFKKYFVAGQE